MTEMSAEICTRYAGCQPNNFFLWQKSKHFIDKQRVHFSPNAHVININRWKCFNLLKRKNFVKAEVAIGGTAI